MEKVKYKVTGYKLVSYEYIIIECKNKFNSKKELISLMKQGKIKVKSENYFVEAESIK